MAPFTWSRWLRSKFRPRVTSYRKPDRRPAVEPLETRLAPATFTWTGGGQDTKWSTNANWSGGVAPSASDILDDLHTLFPEQRQMDLAPAASTLSPDEQSILATIDTMETPLDLIVTKSVAELVVLMTEDPVTTTLPLPSTAMAVAISKLLAGPL